MNRARRKLRARRHIALASEQTRGALRAPRSRWRIALNPLAPARRRPARVAGAGLPLAPHRPLLDLELTPQPLAELAAIVLAHGLVADHRRHLGKARLERRTPFGRVEARGFGLAHPQHVGERTRGGD